MFDRQQWGRERRQSLQRYVLDYLIEHACVDCGEADVIVLEFDHVRGVKWDNISRLIRRGVSLIKLQDEIAKCDVRCANCHRRKTYARFGAVHRNMDNLAAVITSQV